MKRYFFATKNGIISRFIWLESSQTADFNFRTWA